MDGHAQLISVPDRAEFDLVILYQVLQRDHRPLETLRRLSAALRPDGYLFVSVPRIDTIGQHRDFKACLSPKNPVAFTEASLRGLLARAGLETVAALHDLDADWTDGEPMRLRLLARKADRVTPIAEPFEAVARIMDDLAAPAQTAAAQAVECPACSGTDVRVLDEWRLSRRARAAACHTCGLLFVHPQPSQETLDAYYTPEGYAAWKAANLTDKAWAHIDSPERRARRGTPKLFTALDAFFPATHGQGARVLDFGCGPGTWLDHFEDHGWTTYGVEPCTDAAFVRHKRLVEVPSDPRFDLVFLYHVLEHLPRPLDTLRDLSRALVPGGYLFVSVPRLDKIPVHGEIEYCLHPRHHIVAFTEVCLRGLLARAGLTVVESLSDLPHACNRGRPTKLQLLARREIPEHEYPRFDPAAALDPIVRFVSHARRRARQPVDEREIAPGVTARSVT